MCGISGFNWEDKELIQKMNKSIVHRGPDAFGKFLDKGISLGHSRLSIIDLLESEWKASVKRSQGIAIMILEQ